MALIECQHPTANLYDFKGRMEVYDSDLLHPESFSLSTRNLLLRGSRLKNTDFIYGCPVYTGKETKMAINSKLTTNKFSTAERTCNYFLLFFLGLLLVETFLATVGKHQIFGAQKSEELWYIESKLDSWSLAFIMNDALSFFVLFSYIIPISLYVTLEMQKFLGSFFFQWDEDMRCKETGEFAICNTSDLNEELGQVKYLFTDKTGTLTENCMHFRLCSVAGVKFFDQGGHLKSIDEESVEVIPKNIMDMAESFLITLALCHTVVAKKEVCKEPMENDNEAYEDTIDMPKIELKYLASSPDEKALVEACAKYGVIFQGSEDDIMSLMVQGVKKEYELLQVLEFDSDRKMMSVIVRSSSDNQIWVFSKGAETSIVSKSNFVTPAEEALRDITMKHIMDFARLGLRTLAVGSRKLKDSEYDRISEKLKMAKKVIEGREVAILKVTEEVEKDLTLLGATGVEDLLQEGVQETLESLYVAGIKVWVLTGDKIETAVNIAYLCGLFKRFMNVIYLTHLYDQDGTRWKLEQSEKNIKSGDSKFGLVVDGGSLIILLDEFREEFYNVCSQCSAVICCRMSPSQKAEIVKLVKNRNGKRTVCAAVGDGANDVSMIQEAHVGIGIMGKEGRQAVRCSDFALARFRFLQKALLVHGHWYYTRIATLILYCFYKNIVFNTPQLFFTFQNAFSTQSIYDGLVLTVFNLSLTGLPIIIYGLFEQGYSSDNLLKKPYLYKRIKNNRNMSWTVFITWMLLALWHTLTLYYGTVAATIDTAYVPEGKTQDIYLYGMILTANLVLICNVKLIVESRFQTGFFLGSVAFTIFGFYFQYIIYTTKKSTRGMFWTFFVMHTTPVFYFTMLIILVICFLPDVLLKVFSNSRNLYQRNAFKFHF